MSTRREPQWDPTAFDDLLAVMTSLTNVDELRSFLTDLCTRSELTAMTHRWQAVRLVDAGVPYAKIAELTGASTTTVTRVSQWLRYGEGGYRLALDRNPTPDA
jgi:TrpR-related protein YerC/YecD